MVKRAWCVAAALLASVAGAAPTYWLGKAEVGFDLVLGDLAEKGPCAHVTPAAMTSLAAVTNGAGVIRVTWKGHAKYGRDFRVMASLAPQDGGWAWDFSYAGYEGPLAVEDILFPVLTVPRTEATRLLYPQDEGCVRKPDWAALKPAATAASCGPYCKGFHFIATLTPDAENHYLDLRGDARLNVVRFQFRQGRRPQTVEMIAKTTMPVLGGAPAASGALPFGGVIRTFRGESWFTPTAYYRDYVKTQSWYADAVALRRKAPRLRDVGLWLWNRGRSHVVTGIVDRVAHDTGATVALDWYWWHANPYGGEAPYYWPAREDMATFRGTIAALKAKGVYVQHYINGVCCDVKDPRWTDGDWAETVVDRDGKLHVKTWNPFINHPSAYMCGNAPVFHDRMSFLCENLRESGSDGIYIDMIAHMTYYPCWSAKHGHPRGGGMHQYEGYRRLVERVRRENPGTHFSSEGVTEAYLGLWESLILLHSNYEKLFCQTGPTFEAPPVYQAIYHPVVTMFGNYATIDNQPPWDEKWPAEFRRGDLGDLVSGFPDEFAVEVARPVVSGQQPCAHQLFAHHADDPKTAASYRFLCETVKFYAANRDWLYDGEMLDPGALTCPTAEVKFLNYATYSFKGGEKTVVQPALPTVFHGVWRAPDGRVAAMLVNWSRERRAYRLATPDMGVREGVIPPRSWLRLEGERRGGSSRRADCGICGRSGSESNGRTNAECRKTEI